MGWGVVESVGEALASKYVDQIWDIHIEPMPHSVYLIQSSYNDMEGGHKKIPRCLKIS